MNAAVYWLVMMDVAQKLEYGEETDKDGMIRFLAFLVGLGLVANRVL